MTETATRSDLAEQLALSLYLTSFDGLTHDDWCKTHRSVRANHRRQALRLLEEGHLNRILLDHEAQVRGRWVDLIRRTIPATPDPKDETSLARQHRLAATGAFETAATIVRGRPA